MSLAAGLDWRNLSALRGYLICRRGKKWEYRKGETGELTERREARGKEGRDRQWEAVHPQKFSEVGAYAIIDSISAAAAAAAAGGWDVSSSRSTHCHLFSQSQCARGRARRGAAAASSSRSFTHTAVNWISGVPRVMTSLHATSYLHTHVMNTARWWLHHTRLINRQCTPSPINICFVAIDVCFVNDTRYLSSVIIHCVSKNVVSNFLQ